MQQKLKELLQKNGAALVGFADVRHLPIAARRGLPFGVAIGVPLTPAVAAGIPTGPHADYQEEYAQRNDQLDELAALAANWLTAQGHTATAMTRAEVATDRTPLSTPLPHKTVARLAGLGWIGRCALLITEEFGSALRLTSVLTNAPLATGQPQDASRCGSCTACRDVCPGGAITGALWQPGMARKTLVDVEACEAATAKLGLDLNPRHATCGRCITACPFTRRHLRRALGRE